MVAQPIATMREAEYLAFERASEARHEFRDGNVYAMAEIALRHRHIVSSSAFHLHTQLRGTDCTVLITSMRVKVATTGFYAYPNVLVHCGQPRLEDSFANTLLNPMVLIEVLSPASANYDRSTKWLHYQQMESLQEYLLMAHDKPMIEHYVRENARSWIYRTTSGSGLDAIVKLPTIGCTLKLAEAYEQVSLD